MHFHLSVSLLTPIFVHLVQITAVNMNLQQAEAVAPGGPRNGITPEVALQRRIRKRREPSHLLDGNSHKIDLPDRSAKRRKEETKKHATITHGASDVDQIPMFEGLWATTMTYTPAAYLTSMVRSSKKMMKQVIPMVNLNTVRDYQASKANKIRSINVFYSGGLMSKEKYNGKRLALAFKPKEAGNSLRRKRLTLGDNNFQIPSLAPYGQLIRYIKTIDMGPLKDVKDLCNDLDIDDDERIVNGRYRELGDILLRLASMYMKLSRENLCQPPTCINFKDDFAA